MNERTLFSVVFGMTGGILAYLLWGVHATISGVGIVGMTFNLALFFGGAFASGSAAGLGGWLLKR